MRPRSVDARVRTFFFVYTLAAVSLYAIVTSAAPVLGIVLGAW